MFQQQQISHHYMLNTFLLHSFLTMFHSSVVKSATFVCTYFAWFANRLIQNFLKSISNCSAFLSFKGITHAHLLKISIRQNIKQGFIKFTKYFLNLLIFFINYISERSALQILHIEDECFFFLF